MYNLLLRPLLFKLSAEKAHNAAAFFLQMFGLPVFNQLVRLFYTQPKSKSIKVAGISFPSRLGLAAGFDKNASMYKGLSAIGFGFVEIGTVTPLPQPGNDKPRLFRLKEDNALINRMGFNNEGVEVVAKRLANRGKNLIIGGNIGKNKVTPNENAVDDYVKCFHSLHPHVDYFVVNVSSPNTPGLRELQDKKPLTTLLKSLQALNDQKSEQKPIFLKIAPDLSNDQLDDIVQIVKEAGIAGVIATNTTIERAGLKTSQSVVKNIGMGGLSGAPLKERALEVVRYLAEKSQKSFVIIGVGGISSAKDAKDFINAGADLVQVYSAFIYKGPSLIKEINSALN